MTLLYNNILYCYYIVYINIVLLYITILYIVRLRRRLVLELRGRLLGRLVVASPYANDGYTERPEGSRLHFGAQEASPSGAGHSEADGAVGGGSSKVQAS